MTNDEMIEVMDHWGYVVHTKRVVGGTAVSYAHKGEDVDLSKAQVYSDISTAITVAYGWVYWYAVTDLQQRGVLKADD